MIESDAMRCDAMQIFQYYIYIDRNAAKDIIIHSDVIVTLISKINPMENVADFQGGEQILIYLILISFSAVDYKEGSRNLLIHANLMISNKVFLCDYEINPNLFHADAHALGYDHCKQDSTILS
jgi:hypothetical protein